MPKRVLSWVLPVEDARREIDGVILVGALLAAESGLHETFVDTILSVAVLIGTYWLAHSYAAVLSGRLRTDYRLTAGTLWRGLAREAALMRGASIPVIVLLISWVSSVTLADAVTAAVWSSVATLSCLELRAALRASATLLERAVELAFGVTIGLGIVLLKIVLH